MRRRSVPAAVMLAVLGLTLLPGCGLVENAEAIFEHLERESRGALPDTQTPADVTARTDMAVGACVTEYGYDDWDTVTGFQVVDCDAEHYEELYAVVEHTAGEYPGDNRIWKTAEVECIAAFEGYVGVSYEESEYAANWIAPTDLEWRDGDRSTLCLLWDYDYRPLVGSVRGSGR
ncbi:septum formation family protein [Lysobacter korlensis]|uniref:Septum formation family protein n=1 Tax=Lysobacter korlensis TaxID=553636 RepID=A0ABV6RVX6_9GAMM